MDLIMSSLQICSTQLVYGCFEYDEQELGLHRGNTTYSVVSHIKRESVLPIGELASIDCPRSSGLSPSLLSTTRECTVVSTGLTRPSSPLCDRPSSHPIQAKGQATKYFGSWTTLTFTALPTRFFILNFTESRTYSVIYLPGDWMVAASFSFVTLSSFSLHSSYPLPSRSATSATKPD
ncbi:hypothetical protein VTO42DRAFT_1384 [Malbranchea cinnamomea]